MEDRKFNITEVNPYSFWIIFGIGLIFVIATVVDEWDLIYDINPLQLVVLGVFLSFGVALLLSIYKSTYHLNEIGVERKIAFKGIFAFGKSASYRWSDFYMIYPSFEMDFIPPFSKKTTFFLAHRPNLVCSRLFFAKDDYKHFVSSVKKYYKNHLKDENRQPAKRPGFSELIFNKHLMGIMGILGFTGIGIIYFNYQFLLNSLSSFLFLSAPFSISLVYWILLIRKMRS